MQDQLYLKQLGSYYPAYLKGVIQGNAFAPIVLRGGKNKPETYLALETAIRHFQRYEKEAGGKGWVIDWEDWNSKKLGKQVWPARISVETEADFLALLEKEKEAAHFREQLQVLLQWRPAIGPWLAERPGKVLELDAIWTRICAVTDYLLTQEVTGRYLRSLSVPVHTKFIEQYKNTILSIIRHLDPTRCKTPATDIETALGMRTKPFLFPLRWLDTTLQRSIMPGFEVMGITSDSLRLIDWPVKEIWLVENETTLFMLPYRTDAIAICTKGYAVAELKNIGLLERTPLYYWGDMDEDGYHLLSMCRRMYPHTQSIFMDEACCRFHKGETERLTAAYAKLAPTNITDTERIAFDMLKGVNGRIEQEKLQLAYLATGF